MAESALITVKSRTDTKMTSGAGKEFTAVTIESLDGQIYSGYDNQVPDGLKNGDQLNVTFSQIKKKDGNVINKIITTNADGQTTTKTSMTSSGTGGSGTGSSSTSSGKYTKKSNNDYDKNQELSRKGQRLGMTVSKAIDIAIHNASMERTSVSLSTIEGLAQELLELTKRLEKADK